MHFTDSLELDCAAITNIADDHLDWHGGRENYAADKAKVFHRVKRALVYTPTMRWSQPRRMRPKRRKDAVGSASLSVLRKPGRSV